MASFQGFWPVLPQINSGTGYVTRNLTAADYAVAVATFTEANTTITEIVGYIGATKPSVGTIRVGLQSNTNSGTGRGNPSGTWLNNGTSDVYVDIDATTLTINSTFTANIPDYTCARGEPIFIVVTALTTSPVWNGTLEVGQHIPAAWEPSTPYVLYRQAAAWTAITVSAQPALFYRDANRGYMFPMNGFWNDATSSGIGAGAGRLDMAGALFTLPSSICSTFKVSGVVFNGRRNGNDTSTDLIICDTSGTDLQSVTFQTNYLAKYGTSVMVSNYVYFDDSTLATLTAGTQYRVVMRSTAAAASINFYGINIPQLSDGKAYIGDDAEFKWTENNGTDLTTGWSEVNTRIPGITLILADVTEPSSGALLTHPGMAGGMRG